MINSFLSRLLTLRLSQYFKEFVRYYQSESITQQIDNKSMTTATPTTLTLREKKRMWKEHKADKFSQISKDQVSMFNYFLRNNDIFRFIHPSDAKLVTDISIHLMNKEFNAFFGTAAAVFVTDQILLRFAAPKLRIPRFRLVVNLAKYLLAPCIGFTICKEYFQEKEAEALYNIQSKYNFGFEDYNRANRIFERALEANRLEELLEKRAQFDWTGVPELK